MLGALARARRLRRWIQSRRAVPFLAAGERSAVHARHVLLVGRSPVDRVPNAGNLRSQRMEGDPTAARVRRAAPPAGLSRLASGCQPMQRRSRLLLRRRDGVRVRCVLQRPGMHLVRRRAGGISCMELHASPERSQLPQDPPERRRALQRPAWHRLSEDAVRVEHRLPRRHLAVGVQQRVSGVCRARDADCHAGG